MRASSWLNRLLRNERGNVLVIGAASMPLLIGSAALALDTVQMSLWKRQLQRAADSAALAGAYAVAQQKSAPNAVTRDLQLNNDVALTGGPQVQNAPLAGPYLGDNRAVRVILTSQRSMPFMSFFDNTPPTITVEATAASVFQGQFCMVSLEDTGVTGVTFTGNTSVNLGCGVITNSRAANAIVAAGSAQVRATPVGAVGGIPASGAYLQPTTLLPYTLRQADPFSGLPRTPSPPTNCRELGAIEVLPNRQQTVPPSPNTDNQYCVRGGADIKGTLNLASGTYYIDGSTFQLGSQAQLNGTEVTIILTSSTPTVPSSFASLDMHGGAVVNLTSPGSGTYEGILFYQDPRTPYGESQFTGNSASSVEGAFYFPSRQLTYIGNTGSQTRCLQMVARRLVFSGNARIENICPTDGGPESFSATFVRLVA